MKVLKLIMFPALIVGLVVLYLSIFVVKETQRAVKLEFGRVVQADVAPGLHFKIPIVNDVKKFDARILTLDAAPVSYTHLRAHET